MDFYDIISNDFIKNEIISLVGSITAFRELVGGSNRRFYRVFGTKGRSVIVLYDENSRSLESIVQVSKYLNRIANLAPIVHQYLWEFRIIIMEDIGKKSLEASFKSGEEGWSIYKRAVETLILIQSAPKRFEMPVMVEKCVFDREKLLDETRHFLEHFVGNHLQYQISNRDALNTELEKIAEHISRQPLVLMHRDFQSKNIFIHKDSYKVVDIQEACMGPYSYDLAALLCDPYTMISNTLIDKLKAMYLERVKSLGFIAIDDKQFERDFHQSSISRLMQAIGAFARLSASGKEEFAQYIAPAFSRLLSMSEDYPALFDLLKTLSQKVLL